MNKKPKIHVVAGILLNEQGHFLLSSRPVGKVYAGYWEFAGGKVKEGESELAALKREFLEELNIYIDAATPWLTKSHDYEHACVYLRFFKVQQWHGKIEPQENQSVCWQNPEQPNLSPMLPANEAILKALRIPAKLTGSLDGFSWQNTQGCLNILPFNLAGETDGLVLKVTELRKKISNGNHPWVFAQIENQADIDLALAMNADALIFVINNQADKQMAATFLQQGTPLALLLLNHAQLDLTALQPFYPTYLRHQ